MTSFALTDGNNIDLPTTRGLPTHTCSSMDDLISHIDEMADFGIRNQGFFFQDPESEFAHILQERVGLPQIKIKTKNWNKRNQSFQSLLECYFRYIFDSFGSDVEAVFNELKETSMKIGHLNADGSDFVEGGVRIKLSGELENRLKPNFAMKDLPDHIDTHFQFPCMWYQNSLHCHLTSNRYRFDSKSSMKRTFRYATKNFGSLLLTLDYSKEKQNHPLLDGFYDFMTELVDLSNEKVRLNETLYIIPKYPTYTTNHHQDIHVEPHIVIYQHVEKSSLFYFLPILFGLWVQFISEKKEGVSFLPSFYAKCDEAQIGSFGEMTPGDLLIVNPCVSHLVQVPSKNGDAMTLVRAAEMFLELKAN